MDTKSSTRIPKVIQFFTIKIYTLNSNSHLTFVWDHPKSFSQFFKSMKMLSYKNTLSYLLVTNRFFIYFKKNSWVFLNELTQRLKPTTFEFISWFKYNLYTTFQSNDITEFYESRLSHITKSAKTEISRLVCISEYLNLNKFIYFSWRK